MKSVEKNSRFSRLSTKAYWQNLGQGGVNWLSHSLWAKRAISFFFLLLTAVVIAGILHNNREMITNFEWQLRPIWLLYITLFFAIDLMVATWVWHLLVSKLANYHNFRQSAKICWWSNLARRIPTPIWYITGRAVLYEKVGVSKTTTTLLSTLELIFFFLSGIVTTLLTLPFWAIPPQATSTIPPTIIFLLLLPLSIFFVHPRLLQKIWHWLQPNIPLTPLSWQDTITWFTYYILAWFFGALVLFSVINLIMPLAITNLITIIGIWSLAGTISLAGSLTISLIGVREISLTLLLTTLVPAPIALLAALLIRLVWLIGETIGALISYKL